MSRQLRLVGPGGPAGPDDEEDLPRRFAEAMSAIGAAVGYLTAVPELRNNPLYSDNPRHLRIAHAMTWVDVASVFRALIAKGILTEREVLESMTEAAEEERARLTAEARRLGPDPTVSFP